MIFKYSELKQFLTFINKHYCVTSLGKWDGRNAIILRHDVDLDVQAAHRLSCLEQECGVDSTYFFMVSGFTYNVLSASNRKIIKHISQAGFEIGLHFDPTVYENQNIAQLQSNVEREALILENIIEKKVKSISLHNPTTTGKFPLFKNFHNAYDKSIFSADCYISDSRMIFLHDIYEFINKARTTTIQILLHPLHYTENGDSYPAIFRCFIKSHMKQIDYIFSVNRTYRDQLKDGLFGCISRKDLEL